MFKRLITNFSHRPILPLPTSKLLYNKPLLPFCQYQHHEIPPEQAWKTFPYVPFFMSNTKIVLFLALPVLTSIMVPHEFVFDVLALGLGTASLAADYKFINRKPGDPYPKLFGKELTPKIVSNTAYVVSMLASLGVMGEWYAFTSAFTLIGYLIFMGTYRLATEFSTSSFFTKLNVTALGAAASTIVLKTFTDLSELSDYSSIDFDRWAWLMYFPYSYAAGYGFLKVYDAASRQMTVPVSPENLKGDKVEGMFKQMQAWHMDDHLTRFLIVYKWANLGAYMIILGLIGLANSYPAERKIVGKAVPKKEFDDEEDWK